MIASWCIANPRYWYYVRAATGSQYEVHCRRRMAPAAAAAPLTEADGPEGSSGGFEEEVLLDENRRRQDGGFKFYMVSSGPASLQRAGNEGLPSDRAGGQGAEGIGGTAAQSCEPGGGWWNGAGPPAAQAAAAPRPGGAPLQAPPGVHAHCCTHCGRWRWAAAQVDEVAVSPDQTLLAWTEDTVGGEKYDLHVKVGRLV